MGATWSRHQQPSAAELKQVRADIRELEGKVEGIEAQIAKADPGPERVQLRRQLASLDDQLSTLLRKEERLAASAAVPGVVGDVAASTDDGALRSSCQDIEVVSRKGPVPYTAKVENAGRTMISAKVATLESVLAGVPVPQKIMERVISGLTTATHQVFTDPSAIADSEEPAQDLLHKLASDMCKLGNRGLHACDTHVDGYPVDPIGKVDVIVSTTQKPLSGQVLWSTVVAVIKVKTDLSLPAVRKEGYGQLLQRAEAVLDLQPRRTWVLGVLADGRSVEVIRFYRIGRTADVIAFCRSGMFSLERTAQSDGLKLLARLMLASASELGYTAPVLPAWFTVERAGQRWQVQPQQVLQERGTAVYSCTCSRRGSTEVQAVLKVGQCEREASMIQSLNAKEVSGIPRLWHSAAWQQRKSYLIIEPYGRAIVPGSLPAGQILKIAKDVATTVAELHRHEVLHLDVAPSNIIVDEDGNGVLVDFHMAQHGLAVVGHVTRRTFMSLSRLQGGPATLSGELESVLYTVLYWFSNGHLAWENDGGMDEAAATFKEWAMALHFEERVLRKCAVPDHVKGVLRRLKELFFNPQYPDGYNTSVSFTDFVEVLP